MDHKTDFHRLRDSRAADPPDDLAIVLLACIPQWVLAPTVAVLVDCFAEPTEPATEDTDTLTIADIQRTKEKLAS